jgi:hypothetical protein
MGSHAAETECQVVDWREARELAGERFGGRARTKQPAITEETPLATNHN